MLRHFRFNLFLTGEPYKFGVVTTHRKSQGQISDKNAQNDFHFDYFPLKMLTFTLFLELFTAKSITSLSFHRFHLLITNKRASLACTARLADTMCPPEAPCGRLWSPLINYMGDNISKYICPTVIIDIARKITKFVNFSIFDE